MIHQIFEFARSFTSKRWVNYVLILCGLGLSLLVIANIVYRNWTEFQSFHWQLRLLPLIGAGIALVIAFGLNIVTWHLISCTMGSRVGFWKDLEIYSFSTVIRRLPGVIWQLAGRTYMYHQAKTTLAVPLWGSLWEIIVQLLSGMLVTVLMLVFSPQLQARFSVGAWGLLFLIPIGWLVLRPRDLMSLTRWIAPKFASEQNLTCRDALRWVGLYLISWIFGGAILYCLICSLFPQNLTLFFVCIGSVATSGVLAMLVMFIPGELGIREISLVLLLQLYVQSPIAVASTILFRLWLLFGEAFVAVLVFLIVWGRGWLVQINHNTS